MPGSALPGYIIYCPDMKIITAAAAQARAGVTKGTLFHIFTCRVSPGVYVPDPKDLQSHPNPLELFVRV